MVDLTNLEDRCFIHTRLECAYYNYEKVFENDLTREYYQFSENQFIAFYKAMKKCKDEKLDIFELEDEYSEEDEFESKLSELLYNTSVECDVEEDRLYDLYNNLYGGILPDYCDEEERIIVADVKLYKFENKELYYYDDGWKKVF